MTETAVAAAASTMVQGVAPRTESVTVLVSFPAERLQEIKELIDANVGDLRRNNLGVALLEDLCMLSVQQGARAFLFPVPGAARACVQILRAAWPRMLAKGLSPADLGLPLKTDRTQPRFCQEEGLVAEEWKKLSAPWLPKQSKLYSACLLAQSLFPWARLAAQGGCVLRVAVGPLQVPGYVFQHFLEKNTPLTQELGPEIRVKYGRSCSWQQAPLQLCSLGDQIRAEFGLSQSNTLRLVKSADGQDVSLETLLSAGTYELTVEPFLASQQTEAAAQTGEETKKKGEKMQALPVAEKYDAGKNEAERLWKLEGQKAKARDLLKQKNARKHLADAEKALVKAQKKAQDGQKRKRSLSVIMRVVWTSSPTGWPA